MEPEVGGSIPLDPPICYNSTMPKEKKVYKLDIRSIGRPILPPEIVLENMDLADRAPDSTRDNGRRPQTCNPPLVTREDWESDNPYRLQH